MGFEFDGGRYPKDPGCYLIRDASGAVLYVGKAKHLRKRLSSHFLGQPKHGSRFRDHVADVEVMLVSNEHEALLLESNLIKAHRPPYNGPLKDEDEGYHYIVLTKEALPRLIPFRKERINKGLKDAAVGTRFGPYVSRRYRDTLITLAANRFRLRTCSPLPSEVCLRFHLGVCGGVCAQHVDERAYRQAVAQASRFLRRPPKNMVAVLRSEMADAAARLDFEWAAALKQQIAALEVAAMPQAVELDGVGDATYAFVSGDHALLAVVRNGVLRGFEGSSADEVAGRTDITRARNPQEQRLLGLCELNLTYRLGRVRDL